MKQQYKPLTSQVLTNLPEDEVISAVPEQSPLVEESQLKINHATENVLDGRNS